MAFETPEYVSRAFGIAIIVFTATFGKSKDDRLIDRRLDPKMHKASILHVNCIKHYPEGEEVPKGIKI
jgi:hypothetical protein